MSKQPNHQADIKNGNWGTRGTNVTWDKAQGNRGQQLAKARKPRGGKSVEGRGQQGNQKK